MLLSLPCCSEIMWPPDVLERKGVLDLVLQIQPARTNDSTGTANWVDEVDERSSFQMKSNGERN